jgi:DsbC/DsbD-like thiol-disulfide interchange protein
MPSSSTLVLAAAALLVGCASAHDAQAQTPVHWRAAPATIGANGMGHVALTAAIDDGWHIYAVTQGPGGPVPTRFTLAPGQPLALAGEPAVAPAPRSEMDESFGIQVQMHEHHATFTIPVKVTTGARPDSVHVRARYQACNASLCLPPQTAQLTAPVVRGAR